MRRFDGAQNLVRKNLYLYVFLRRFAPFLCRFLDLEDGFSFLSRIQPLNSTIAIDVGSNDGTSIALISKHMSQFEVTCFDPIRAPNSYTPSNAQISYFPFALSDSTGSFNIFTPLVRGFRLTQYSSMQEQRMLTQLEHDLGLSIQDIFLEVKQVQIYRLDDFGLQPFFLKIDVEGVEINVLRGSQETIRLSRPVVLVEIQNQVLYQEISEFMRYLGYANYAPSSIKMKNWNDLALQTEFVSKYNNYLWLPDASSPSWTYK